MGPLDPCIFPSPTAPVMDIWNWATGPRSPFGTVASWEVANLDGDYDSYDDEDMSVYIKLITSRDNRDVNVLNVCTVYIYIDI